MKVTVIIERGDNGYSVYTESTMSTIIGEGKTVTEAKADFKATLEEVIAFHKADGMPVPEGLDTAEFEYKYDISALFDEYRYFNVSMLAKEIGIAPSLLRYYKTKKGAYISDTQAKKIEAGLHEIGERLTKVAL